MIRLPGFTQPAFWPSPVNKRASNPLYRPPQEKGDTFTRTQPIRFAAHPQRPSTIPEYSDETQTLPEQVWCELRSKGFIPGSLPVLGRGMESVVYKVSDQFVFRVPIRYEGTNWDFRREDICEHADEPKALRWIHNIGKPVAKVYVDENPLFFHRLMQGEKASINYNYLSLAGQVPDGEQDAFNQKYRTYLESISQFPAQSYRRLNWAIHKLDEAGYAIDPGANNLMIDTDKQQFSLVDYKKVQEALDNGMFPVNEHNNLAYQMAMLIDMQYKSKIRCRTVPDEEEQTLCRKILEKTLVAAADLKRDHGVSVKLPGSSFNQDHVEDHSCNSFTPEEIFEACGLKGSNWGEIQKALISQQQGSENAYRNTVAIIKRNLSP